MEEQIKAFSVSLIKNVWETNVRKIKMLPCHKCGHLNRWKKRVDTEPPTKKKWVKIESYCIKCWKEEFWE